MPFSCRPWDEGILATPAPLNPLVSLQPLPVSSPTHFPPLLQQTAFFPRQHNAIARVFGESAANTNVMATPVFSASIDSDTGQKRPCGPPAQAHIFRLWHPFACHVVHRSACVTVFGCGRQPKGGCHKVCGWGDTSPQQCGPPCPALVCCALLYLSFHRTRLYPMFAWDEPTWSSPQSCWGQAEHCTLCGRMSLG